MEAMMRQIPTRQVGKDDNTQSNHDDVSSSSPTDYLLDGQLDTVEVCSTQLWFPSQFNSWNGLPGWSHDDTALATETWSYQDSYYAGSTDIWTPGFTNCRVDSSTTLEFQSFGSMSSNLSLDKGKPQYQDPSQEHSSQVRNRQIYPAVLPVLESPSCPEISPYNRLVQHKALDSDWIAFTPRLSFTPHQPASDTIPKLTASRIPATNPTLNWPITSQTIPNVSNPCNDDATPMPKRKHTSSTPPHAKKTRRAMPQVELAEYVGVFENAPGALNTVKKRKKLDGSVRKAAQDVRKAGACHQCRLRKRTCSIGTPCTSCLKNGRGLHELKCQRESPFIGNSIHQYFEHSSTKRYLGFNIMMSPLPSMSADTCYVTIDGIGQLSHTVKLRAHITPLDSFNVADRTMIGKTEDKSKKPADKNDGNPSVLILEDHEALGTQVEQWAVEYASKFVHAAGPRFYPTTAAVILGTAYVKKGLPESELIAAMLRAASIAFILRAGVKHTSSSDKSNSRYRTIQASIDTILYQRLKLAERDLYKMLQRIVFRSLGYVAREQIYPVALVFWQLLRMLCLSSSHLSNISRRFQSIPSEHASFQYHALKLVVSTHFAIFRSSNPLLLDFNKRGNQDLLGGDAELIELAMKMRKVVLDFRDKGVRDMKGSIAYRKEHFDLFRKVYNGL
ncbi:hypothetical protein EG329_002910 [Mollisiaceae sp. DMI_Dod_QoI]|nr:hypothetical protein EG329_002910 [Helotiales sp. DMI_Dod_QoI]